ncbi:hypothetical protein [Nocardioides sp.]|uniref:hypothetical protein n=1 Tax=Nocardioides sp. TaxID=35761 RepID=UPI002B2743CF|nr:hypothetical protein [Nocardioides sp.]
MPESPSASSRRSVLKGAAWTAPAIVLASAAPAFAASGAASITQTVVGVLDRPNLKMTTTVDYNNLNTGATTATAIVTLRSSAGQIATGDPSFVSDGWTFSGVTPAGSAFIREYTFNGAIPGAPDASSTQPSSLVFTVGVEPAVGGLVGGSIDVTTSVPPPAGITPNPVRGPWGDIPAT